ncbi:von Willebrand factor-like [Cherax quadricarinatus]
MGFYTTLLLLLPSLVAAGKPSTQGCCFGTSTLKHGEVALSLPSCCLSLVCENGLIQKHFVGGPGASQCCEFDGLMYQNGSKLVAQCIPLVCVGGAWTPTQKIEECCKHCYLYNDPHIKTFDGYYYNWNGLCNYSLAQSDFSYTPEVGVYSTFQFCKGHASCLSQTTFKDNAHTVITIDCSSTTFDVIVNGDKYTVPQTGVANVQSSQGAQPVLTWRETDCIYFLGSSKLVIQHCPGRLHIWAYPSHTNHLDGLCGHFNFYEVDDFTDRHQHVYPLQSFPLAFPESWRTRHQVNTHCLHCNGCDAQTAVDPCQPAPLKEDLAQCQSLMNPIIGRDVELEPHVEACAWDLCMMRSTGATASQMSDWLIQLQIILQQIKLIFARTRDSWVPHGPPSSGTCSPGSSWMTNCNNCSCTSTGTLAACTKLLCILGYKHPLGTNSCKDGSWWMKDECNWCECVRGGAICTYSSCTASDSPLVPVCPFLACQANCTKTWNPDTGCSTCFCPTDNGPVTGIADPPIAPCLPIDCPRTCQVVVSAATNCPTCNCDCPIDPSTYLPLCPQDCSIIYTKNPETGCEECICDPEYQDYHPKSTLVYNCQDNELSCPEDCERVRNKDTGCVDCVCQ